MNDPQVMVGNNIRRLRAKHALTRERLSDISGVSLADIRAIEQGLNLRRNSNILPVLVALASALNVSAATLLEEVGDK